MAKKKSKNALPKRIGGVKIPKKVRKSRFGRLLASPQVLETLAAAGVAGAGALIAKQQAGKDTPIGHAVDSANDTAKDVKHAGADASQQFAYALGEAARSFAEALHRHDPSKPRTEAAATPGERKLRAQLERNAAP